MHAFRYFKNYYASHSNNKALVSIPNNVIVKIIPFKDIKKEAFINANTRKRDAELEKRLFDNMFEVVLHHDYESVYLYREIEA